MTWKRVLISTWVLPFLVMHNNVQAESVLRAQFVLEFEKGKTSKAPFIAKLPLFEQYGLHSVDTNPDVIIVCGSENTIQMASKSKIPMIVLDPTEMASLKPFLRKALQNSCVKKVFKNTTLRPVELYKYKETYHDSLIKKCVLTIQKNAKKNVLYKIESVLWDQNRSAFAKRFEVFRDEQPNFEAPRSVDVSLVCGLTVCKKYGTLKETHRRMAFRELEKIQNKKVVLSQGGVPYEEYLALLKDSKIVVSPWGTGEWCWRDFEAVYTGAVLIKPDTSFVKSMPDLYQNGLYYVACAHDFSDLREKISHVLNNYEKFTDMRKRARKLLVDYWDDEKIAKDFVEAIKNALNK